MPEVAVFPQAKQRSPIFYLEVLSRLERCAVCIGEGTGSVLRATSTNVGKSLVSTSG